MEASRRMQNGVKLQACLMDIPFYIIFTNKWLECIICPESYVDPCFVEMTHIKESCLHKNIDKLAVGLVGMFPTHLQASQTRRKNLFFKIKSQQDLAAL